MVVVSKLIQPIGAPGDDWFKYIDWMDEARSDYHRAVIIRRTRKDFTVKTITLEMRYDNQDDPNIDKAVRQVAKQAARDMRAMLLLVSGNARAPQFALTSTDFFAGTDDINIDEPDEGEGEGDGDADAS